MRARTRARLTQEALSPSTIASELGDPGHGAQTLFVGVVRDENHGRRVRAVSYDAHPALAERALAEIARETAERWAGTQVIVEHRTGRLAVGEASVVIGTSSRHRDEAYQASRHVIEEIKKRVPIWKKEHYEDGESDWLRGHALCRHG